MLGMATMMCRCFDPDQDEHAEEVLQERDPGVAADHRQAERRNDPLPKGLDDRRKEDDEAVEDEEVKNPRIDVAEHSGMGPYVAEDTSDALREAIDAIFVGTQAQHAIELARPNGEVRDGCQ